MTLEDFEAEFPTESHFVERKAGTGYKPLQESIVAFSNADGGVILIGVNNSGQILGRELTQGVADALHQVMADVRDPGRYEMQPLIVNGTAITVLSIAKRVEGFAQTSNARVLQRRGTRDESLFGSDLRQFLNERSLERYEETPTGLALSDASDILLGEVASAYDWTDPATYPKRLEERGMVVPKGSDLQLTIAGALYLLPKPQERLGKAYIEILRFGEDAADYDRRIEITGPLQVQVSDSASLVMDELGSELVVLGLRRHEIPRLPRVVLREAIANAVAHRSYEFDGQSGPDRAAAGIRKDHFPGVAS
jgi:ATP-dependent DNA helicase RecG